MDITTGTELLALCDRLGLPISAVARRLEAERSGKPESEIVEQMTRTVTVMHSGFNVHTESRSHRLGKRFSPSK